MNEDGSASVHSALFLLVTRILIDHSLLEVISGEFSPPYIRKTPDFGEASSLPELKKTAERYKALGPSGDAWLRSAFQNIAGKFQADEVWDYVKNWLDEANKDASAVGVSEPDSQDDADSGYEEWEPLKIERDSTAYKDAVDASEAAVREIETSNGYAASEPEERNAVVASTKGTLEAIKTGLPSKQSIRHGLLAPLRFISKKFAETTIGEIAKIAVVKLMAWLAGL